MKAFLFRFTWAFFWLLIGLVIAQSNQLVQPEWIAAIMLFSLLFADGLRLLIKKILTHAINT